MSEIFSTDQLRAIFRHAKTQQDQISDRASHRLALDYLYGRQRADVEAELNQRYNQHQSGDKGEQIKAITFPLTQRYVAESATLYNRPVTYELTREDGTVDEAATEVLQDLLTESGHQDRMHLIEQITSLLVSCGCWYQENLEDMVARATAPNIVWPILDPEIEYPDKTNPLHYLGYVVLLSEKDNSRDSKNSYVFVTQAEHIYYRGDTPFEFETDSLERVSNPYTAQQETENGTVDDKLQMMVVYNVLMPINSLLVDTDPDIVYLNREINVAWSVIAHVIRTQAHSQMIIKLMNADSAPARLNYGPMFAMVMDAAGGEDASFVNAGNNYTETVQALESMQQLYALARRLSPNDFATDGTAPASGFAKLVDSLPKIEARDERAARFKRAEEKDGWPRIGAIMKRKGLLANPEAYNMRVTFSEMAFPRSVDEDIKEAEHNYKHGISSPARDLAKEEGLTMEEAEERIRTEKQEAQGGQTGLDRIVAQRSGRGRGNPRERGKEPGRDQGDDKEQRDE